jgi:hypothetical protein
MFAAPECAVDYLGSAACNWTADEIDFAGCMFNAAPVLKNRTGWIALNEGLTFAWDAKRRAPCSQN